MSIARFPGMVAIGVVARRAMRGAFIWGAVFGVVTWLEAVQFGQEYPTAADRARLVATMGSDVGFQAIFGPGPHIDTIHGYVAAHAVGVLGVIGAVWALLASTRLLRGEEDAGRWEVLLAGPTTRRRAMAAAVAGLGVGLGLLWALTAAAYVAVGRGTDAGFSLGASLFAATATVAATAMFLAVGALCSQLAATRRQAVGWAALVFGVAYLIRVVAYSTSLRWLRWVSPLGWVDELRPLTGNRPLALVPITVTISVLVVLTILLAGRRDLGAGVRPAHDTKPAHTRLLTGPLGLAARLGRGTALGWIGGLTMGALIIGLIAKGSADVWANQSSGMFTTLTGTQGGAVFLGVVFLLVAFLVAMAAAGQVAATREEEAQGYLDHLLARPVARLPWLAGRLAVSAVLLAGLGVVAGVGTWIGTGITGAGLDFGTLLAAGVNIVPVGILVLGLGTLVHGLAPRYAAPFAYGLVAWSFLVEIIGASLGASRWLLDTSVLHHIARAPAADVRWDSAAILIGIGVAAAALGAFAFTRRDFHGG
ncbi:ABC transporter permease subunit [Actinophytocola sp.]|uniref:ABC transporter permease subunit n=1 Tax=Actinophytocola sp. TaxID=1872138 RepID=UPI002D7E5202|nr:ABC transporter permease subunit [Actinophytocola sp.]HET9139281.1 ABC transporter permease subunit [Actinophytocola sp.]